MRSVWRSIARPGLSSARSVWRPSATSSFWRSISGRSSSSCSAIPLLIRIVRLAKSEKITSIADFLGARYGKSFAVASIATLIAVVGAVPYIALQLKAISGSVSLMVEHYTGSPPSFDPFVSDISLIVAMLLALFAVLFGTRHADATEHQNGLVLAVAIESMVKLAAFIAVGLAVTFMLFGGPGDMFAKLSQTPSVRQAR
jgi:Na+/proline symporter